MSLPAGKFLSVPPEKRLEQLIRYYGYLSGRKMYNIVAASTLNTSTIRIQRKAVDVICTVIDPAIDEDLLIIDGLCEPEWCVTVIIRRSELESIYDE